MQIDEYKRLTAKSKYGNKKTYYAGEKYDSAGEARWAEFLDTCKSARNENKVISWKRQVPFPFYIGEKLCFKYIADFVVEYAYGRTEIQDFKGMLTDIYKLKKKIIEAHYKIKIREITKKDLPM